MRFCTICLRPGINIIYGRIAICTVISEIFFLICQNATYSLKIRIHIIAKMGETVQDEVYSNEKAQRG
jgi:hypothetical protein